jgi:hypothetical protein
VRPFASLPRVWTLEPNSQFSHASILGWSDFGRAKSNPFERRSDSRADVSRLDWKEIGYLPSRTFSSTRNQERFWKGRPICRSFRSGTTLLKYSSLPDIPLLTLSRHFEYCVLKKSNTSTQASCDPLNPPRFFRRVRPHPSGRPSPSRCRPGFPRTRPCSASDRLVPMDDECWGIPTLPNSKTGATQ